MWNNIEQCRIMSNNIELRGGGRDIVYISRSILVNPLWDYQSDIYWTGVLRCDKLVCYIIV